MSSEKTVIGINENTAKGLRVLSKRLEESEEKMVATTKRFTDRFDEIKSTLGIYEGKVQDLIDEFDKQKDPVLQTSKKVREQALTWAERIEEQINSQGT